MLATEGLTKQFGGLVAVDNVSIQVARGEVLGLLGDNGAGKSTLIKLISGVYPSTSGRVLLEGEPVAFHSPADARNAGIETIYQDLALADNLDTPANIFLGREWVTKRWGVFNTVDTRGMELESSGVLDRLDIHVPSLKRRIRDLSGGQRQAVAIARSIYWQAKVMIMDEPTAALGVPEQRKVLELIRVLRQQGVPVIVISHNMHDVFAVADRAVVMRRGRLVADLVVAQTTQEEIVGQMVGSVSADADS